MNIQKISTSQINKTFLHSQNNKNNHTPYFSKNTTNRIHFPISAYKANLQPSFGKQSKVKNIKIIDRDTGKAVSASLYKEVNGSVVKYEMFENNRKIGFMCMNFSSPVNETDDCILLESDNTIPRITHLRTIEGNKYMGIGSAFLNTAVEESIKRGKKGSLWLVAETGYGKSYSRYRQNDSPFPFYYKLGFEAVNKEIDASIRKGIRLSDDSFFPKSATLILPANRAGYVRRYYQEKYTVDLD